MDARLWQVRAERYAKPVGFPAKDNLFGSIDSNQWGESEDRPTPEFHSSRLQATVQHRHWISFSSSTENDARDQLTLPAVSQGIDSLVTELFQYNGIDSNTKITCRCLDAARNLVFWRQHEPFAAAIGRYWALSPTANTTAACSARSIYAKPEPGQGTSQSAFYRAHRFGRIDGRFSPALLSADVTWLCFHGRFLSGDAR